VPGAAEAVQTTRTSRVGQGGWKESTEQAYATACAPAPHLHSYLCLSGVELAIQLCFRSRSMRGRVRFV
jgi:hypothetical protein